MTTSVGFSLGSNVGNKTSNLQEAITALNALEGLELTEISHFYKTPPWGITDQDWFVNLCAIGETTLLPETLLKACQSIEADVGRKKTRKWGPRVIDIDILFMEGVELKEPHLTLPHPHIHERAFVIAPLLEIAPETLINNISIQASADYLQDEIASITSMEAPIPFL